MNKLIAVVVLAAISTAAYFGYQQYGDVVKGRVVATVCVNHVNDYVAQKGGSVLSVAAEDVNGVFTMNIHHEAPVGWVKPNLTTSCHLEGFKVVVETEMDSKVASWYVENIYNRFASK